MHMNWVLHWMHRISVIDNTNFHHITFFKCPVHIHIFFIRCCINQFPSHHIFIGRRIHRTHGIFPLNGVCVATPHLHRMTTHIHMHTLHGVACILVVHHGKRELECFIWCFIKILTKRVHTCYGVLMSSELVKCLCIGSTRACL